MATTPTPVPNMNPTGVVGSGAGNVMPGQTGTGFSTFGTGGPGTMGFGNSMNPTPTATSSNPYSTTMPGGSAPGTSVTGSGGTTATPNSFNQTQGQQNRTLGEMQTYYGEGMGSLIYQYLQSSGGYNGALTQQVVGDQQNAMQHQIQEGENTLAGTLGAMGVSGSSTEMAGALTDYQNQAVTQENAITSQEYYNMWNQSQQDELSMLEQAANVNAVGTANQPNWMDYLSFGIGGASAAGTLMKGLGAIGV